MLDPDAVRVIERLSRRGHTAYLVGGGVRDLLLGRSPKDFDIATSAHPEEVRAIFRNCRLIGRRFRLAHLYFSGGKIIEVATFRRDPRLNETSDEVIDETAQDIGNDEGQDNEAASAVEFVELAQDSAPISDAPEPIVWNDNAFGTPEEDALRRDFTVNGLFLDLNSSQIIDFVGGLQDLNQRVLRTIGDAAQRFQEDPVRMLRAIKFCARLDFGMAPDMVRALSSCRADIMLASKARVFEEILRLLRCGHAYEAFLLCDESGLLNEILPSLTAHLDDSTHHRRQFRQRLRALDRYTLTHSTPSDGVLLASLLFGPGTENTTKEKKRLWLDGLRTHFALTQRLKDALITLWVAHETIAKTKDLGQRRRMIKRMQGRRWFDEFRVLEKIIYAR